jgi:hypothetical protein
MEPKRNSLFQFFPFMKTELFTVLAVKEPKNNSSRTSCPLKMQYFRLKRQNPIIMGRRFLAQKN